ncbi:guanine nucleotide exchange factor for Rab-3A-like isoform X1 [Lingula anatina]|uniref:Guanine nucleotide exchange factor for Rab-3A-like isoform X1 n=1 Tax=Lingula anatina TaxID=7574 RepID=A0A1S3IK11_LINAN|nr:guanine nucleotide exchange factor for Rab-3A-like isoform X1 [Lingula anatina]|eukprot:XP_013398448.1 guanine nucleotide exchange factor for Rab-3A-like isoform X1 [Lingula anatina]
MTDSDLAGTTTLKTAIATSDVAEGYSSRGSGESGDKTKENNNLKDPTMLSTGFVQMKTSKVTQRPQGDDREMAPSDSGVKDASVVKGQSLSSLPKDERNKQTENTPLVIVNGEHDRSELEDTVEVTMREFKSDTYPRRRRSASMAEVKEQAYGRLQDELNKAQQELKLKDEECEKLLEVRDQMGRELEELTASLFEEANNMVQDANIKRMHAEKLLKEANTKIEVLQAEVVALKALVITSTPSMPNKHLHPQLEHEKKKKEGSASPKLSFIKGHRRSTSHHDIKAVAVEPVKSEEIQKKEADPIFLHEFREWKKDPNHNNSNAFITRVEQEDVIPCLCFTNKELSSRVLATVQNNSLTIEPIPGNVQGNGNIPKKCALSEAPRICKFRMKCGDSETWYFVSEAARNRITAVCDLYTYLRYIKQGLVKSEDTDMYWHIIKLRKAMAMARLGLSS